MLRLSSEATNPGDLNSLVRELSLSLPVGLGTRRPPGLPGPRGFTPPPRLFAAPPPSFLTETTLVAADPASAKRLLRFEMKALRPTLAKASRDAAERVAEGAHMAELARFKVVAGYRPIQDEIDPGPLMARLAARGASLALPVTAPKGSEQPMTYRRWSEGEPLHLSSFRVMEPAGEAPAVIPELIITPLIAFDRTGARLGYGQGHFDRTLSALRRDHAVFVLGLAYTGQEVARLPAEAHDERLDAVLTEKGWIDIPR